MIAFINAHRAIHGVEPISKVLPIAPSTYRAHIARRADPSKVLARSQSDAELSLAIWRVWEGNFQVYGVRKVWRQLGREGIDVARCTVARLMKHMGLKGARRGKVVRTTISDRTTSRSAGDPAVLIRLLRLELSSGHGRVSARNWAPVTQHRQQSETSHVMVQPLPFQSPVSDQIVRLENGLGTRPIYLDHQATTPLDPCVLNAMIPYFIEEYGNPHATEHSYGQRAADAIAAARAKIAALVGAEPREVIFTSGATESNNLLLRTAAAAAAARGRRHIITCRTEHKAVIEVVRRLEADGCEVTWLDVQQDGLIDTAAFSSALRSNTGLATIMFANNEIGVLQPVAEIGQICADAGIYFHSDCAQAVGKVEIDMKSMHIDLISISAHKLYGPKGVGAAIIRRTSGLRPLPMIVGGGQEGGARAGTLPTPLCVGFGAAAEITRTCMQAEATRLSALRDRLLAGLRTKVAFEVNGALEPRLPGNLNLSFDGVDAEALIMAVRDKVAIASGSACTATSLETSHVLQALGLNEERAEGAVRIGLGRFTTESDVETAIEALVAAVTSLAPLKRGRFS